MTTSTLMDTPTAVQLLRPEMSYATFVTFRRALIVNYREYWNPMAFIAAMAGSRFDNSAK